MVDDDDGGGFPSPEPRTHSRSALSRNITAWRWLRIVKRDETFSLTYLSTKENIWSWSRGQWTSRGPMRVGGALPPPGRAPCLVGPLMLHRPQFQLHIFRFAEKKIREKVSSCFTTQSRRQALISLGRADLEFVRGFGEGDSSPSSSSTILHHQFHDALRRA